MNEEQLIRSLIRDDMVNYKLVNGLNEMGVDAIHYFLHLSETIFSLMGFDDHEKNDEIYERYLTLIQQVRDINIKTEDGALNELTLRIYKELNAIKVVKRHY